MHQNATGADCGRCGSLGLVRQGAPQAGNAGTLPRPLATMHRRAPISRRSV